MVRRTVARAFGPRAAIGACAVLLLATAGAIPASAAPHPVPKGKPPSVVGLAPVARPKAKPGAPLPHRAGPVPLDRSRSVRPRAGLGPLTATAAPVALRALVIGVNADDWGVATWRSTLDRVGAAYDVLYSSSTPLSGSTLVRPDGTGRYNAVLLTNSAQVYDNGTGTYTSGFDATAWNTLWAYERDYAVRQAALYTSYGTSPEDYCLSASSEGGVADTALPATLTAAGAGIFDYLRATVSVPIQQSYVYRDRLTAGCAADPVLVAGDDVLGVRSTSTDGRQRLALTFTSNQYLVQSDLLGYGLFRWASRGMFLGEQRHYLETDVDDWFNTSDELLPDGTLDTSPGYQVSGHDAVNLDQRLTELRSRYPQAAGFTPSIAYNGGDADLGAGTACAPNGGILTLTATTRCLAGNFRWINHTLDHTELNVTDEATTRNQISQNLTVAGTLGLTVPPGVLKTPAYSGLGVYNPDPNDDVDPPTDHGLGASNPNLLAAADALGVTYLHGNMSFPSEVPSCFDCGITHPLDANLTVVPDWPTNIWYFSTTPDEESYFYNKYYGPGGLYPYWPQDLTYAQILDYETDVALGHLASGSVYTHTFHIGNVRDYGSGNTLLTDWLDRLLAKYDADYAVPLLSPDWPTLAAYAKSRTGHFAELAAGAGAVYDPAAGTVTVSSPVAGTVTVSGALTDGHTSYGTDVSAPVTLTAGGAVSAPANPLA